MLLRVNRTAVAYALGCALSLASADFFLKLSSGRIGRSAGTLIYAATATLVAAGWVVSSRLRGVPLGLTPAGVGASALVGVSFMMVVAFLSGLFAAGANLSVAVPVARLTGMVLAALLGIVVLGEPITWRLGLGALLTFAGVYFIVAR
jgi:drug/metabolite transporter (DMT)-like permease